MGLDELLKEVLGGLMKGRAPEPTEPPDSTGAEPQIGSTVGGPLHAVVQVVALNQSTFGGLSSAWTGSGSIVHPAGVVLTNCHVAAPQEMGIRAPASNRLAMAITERSDQPPAISYFLEIVAFDPQLDLAVLRVVADVRGRPVRDLDLPSVALGDSDQLQLGDRLSIFGYPGIGGETVTMTSGNVSGFSREEGVRSNRAWIKTDATIAGGNSGGMAVNDRGELVGIPTQAAAGAGVTPVDARPVFDTNRDGRIDQRDAPVAVGGFINGLRPIRLAYPLLEKAGMRVVPGQRYASSGSTAPAAPTAPTAPSAARGAPQFSDLLFSPRITDDGRPIGPTTQVMGEPQDVYATFEYQDMVPGTPWTARWTSQGREVIKQEGAWDDGPSGRKAVKISNRKGIPAGSYELELAIQGRTALTGRVTVGPGEDASDSQITGQLVDGQTGQGISNGVVMVLKPGVDLNRFMRTNDQSMLYTTTESGRDGGFSLPKQLPKGNAYSLIAYAKGYAPMAIENGLSVNRTAPEKANVGQIPLNRA
jgi:hypothetical protein